MVVAVLLWGFAGLFLAGSSVGSFVLLAVLVGGSGCRVVFFAIRRMHHKRASR